MQALILAGGLGTRLRPLTVNTPKPVVPICNRAFLFYQIDILRQAGIKDITLSLAYRPDKIERLLGDGSRLGVKLRYRIEPQPMGTAGAFKFAEDVIHERTVVFNGDILTDLDLEAVIRQHEERRETETDGRVRRFLEKPKAGEITVNTINAGTYVLEPRVLDLIPAGQNCSFEYDLFPALLRRGEDFFAHVPQNAYWLDIGTAARYLQAHADLLADRVGRLRITERRPASAPEAAAEIDDISVIGAGCTIRPGAQIINSVLGQGCYVDEGARIEDSVIWSYTRVEAGASIFRSIIGRNSRIGRAAQVGPGAVLGDKTSLSDYTRTCGEL